ncbi:MAG: hypothetical protein KDJ51_10010, partial [Nitratireductor sp.]|nr:hypothetical protein [Nitratireductor sp.]
MNALAHRPQNHFADQRADERWGIVEEADRPALEIVPVQPARMDVEPVDMVLQQPFDRQANALLAFAVTARKIDAVFFFKVALDEG